MRIGVRIGGGFVVALLAVALVAGGTWLTATELVETSHRVDRANEALRAIDDLQEDLVDVESGARGYLLTGDETFLSHHYEAKARAPRALARVEALVDRSSLKQHAADVEGLLQERLDLTDELVRARREQSTVSPATVLSVRTGRHVMDELRQRLGSLRDDEERLLSERVAQSRARAHAVFGFIIGSGLAMALLVVTATLWLTRSITRPLASLSAATERIGRGEDPALDTTRGDELGTLARTLAESLRLRRAAETRERELLDQASEAYFLADLDGRYIDVNDAACRLLQCERKQILGKTIFDLIPPEDVTRLAAAREELLEPGRTQIAEWRLKRNDGSYVPVEVSAKILPGGRWQAFARDVTERRRAEAEREEVLADERARRRRYELLRDSSLAVAELGGATGERLPQVRRTIAEEARRLGSADAALLLEHDAHDQVAVRASVGTTALDEAQLLALLTPRLHVTRSQRGELRVADGALSLLVVPLPARHRVGILCLVRGGDRPFTDDEHRSVELLVAPAAVAVENARLYDELHAALAARQEVLGVVAHDLKSPLNAIALREQLLCRGGKDARLEAHAQSVQRAVAMMQQMIRGLLDSARLDAGELHLDVREVAIDGLVAEVLDLLAPTAEDRGVRLEVRVPSLTVRADRERLAQVLHNLVGNAIKFTQSGGVVTVAAARQGRALEMSVSDTGAGIPPDVLPRVFDRYFTTAAGHGGTGLGLHIARALVEAHGGAMTADSTLGVGSTFRFTLPEPTA